MRKYLSFIAVMLLSVSSLSFAQDTSSEDNSVEARIAQVVAQSEDTASAVQALLAEGSTELTETQKVALASLPAEAQAFFIESVASGQEATDAALTTASTQAGVTTDMGTTLFEAFSPMLAETNQGNLFQTAAGASATGPIGFGTGAGGGGGGGAAASGN
ncbi:hypothetical protein JC525_18255 [Alteromonas sp. IB21]|uniref:hypothetical protein n=1 Tax=Alteromonas sp. IB21 TaxID=2779369 RepID=UPI0018E73589|nr:hypothetical protein [Alteromonas sp. IB21]MBJ2130877.1 hypothetical protein [Alteromonas sp. IB21]